MSQPAPKTDLKQLFLTFAVVTLGFMLVQSSCKQTPETRDSAKILQEMQGNSREIKDMTIAQTLPVLERKLGEEVKDKKIDQPTADTRLMHGKLLVAYTQYKAARPLPLPPNPNEKDRARTKGDFNRIIPAHDAISALQQEFKNKPIWNQQFEVPPSPNFPRATLSFPELAALVEADSRVLGKDTPVWGFFDGYGLIDWLVHATGANPAYSYALAALIMAFLVRLVVFPLAQKTFIHARQMSQLTPLVNEIRQEYKDKGKDKDLTAQNEMNQRVMGLYKEYGLNPMAGCFPAMLQMPLFLLIYQSMLHYRFEFQKGTFLWINQGTHDSTSGWVAANLGQKDFLLIVIYGISMVMTTLLTPVNDPSNAKQQRMIGVGMSVMFTIMMFFWPVPSAFPLYWIFTNIFATLQSQWTYRLKLPPLQKVNAPTGGVFPKAAPAPNGYIPPSTNGKKPSTGTPKRHKPKKKK